MLTTIMPPAVDVQHVQKQNLFIPAWLIQNFIFPSLFCLFLSLLIYKHYSQRIQLALNTHSTSSSSMWENVSRARSRNNSRKIFLQAFSENFKKFIFCFEILSCLVMLLCLIVEFSPMLFVHVYVSTLILCSIISFG